MTVTLTRFQAQYPDLIVRYLTGEELLRLEYGEAHVAIRAGKKPDNPDNVVQPFLPQDVALYASQSYADAYGLPSRLEDLKDHRIVSVDNFNPRAPFFRWLAENVPHDQIVFRATDGRVIRDAILAGVGIGFSTVWEAERYPGLIRVFDHRPEWSVPTWIVTHVDLHRTTKVQSFLSFLKEDAKSW